MDAALGGELRDGLLLPEEFVDDPCLEGGRKLFPHVYDPSRRATPPHWPDFGVHYNQFVTVIESNFAIFSPLNPK